MRARNSTEDWMRRAIRLSLRGYPAPNPRVGCVIVSAGQLVGEGWHAHAGGPHAEVMALTQAGASAKDADVYVSLEPCNHQGRTGPCTEALVRAGVRRVVAACKDPNPLAQGGMERLAREGIETEIGALRAEAEAANRLWLTAMRLGRPTVVVKAAVSLDGRIALPSGESQWITGERARAQGRKLRAELGAVLVGRATAVQDDPSLTARIRGVRNEPKRFVLDPSRRVPDGAKLFQDPEGAVRVVGPGFAGNAQDLEIAATQGRLDLAELLVRMWARGITGLLVEGGARTIAWFFESGFVDRVDLFVAPRILGAGPAWVEGLQNGAIARSPSFEGPRVRRIGEDLWLQAWAAHKE